jgi:hypothetical protein
MRMVSVNREKSRVILSIAAGAADPKRENRKLSAALFLPLAVHKPAKTPPVAMMRVNRPQHVGRRPLLRPKRSQRDEIAALLVEWTDLDRQSE